MKLVYTHENRLFVANAKNLLELQGISVVLKNEFAAGGSGELGFMDVWPELWVLDDADEMKAKHWISSALSQDDEADWTCKHCGEKNPAAFEVCWQCAQENPAKSG